MTKKDYELLAATIKENYDRFTQYIEEGHETYVNTRWGVVRLAEELAIALERANPRFNATKFLHACGGLGIYS